MTSRERWVRLKPLVEPALELPPEDRPGYLQDACRDDVALAQDARRLLDACERADRSLHFLDSPAVELAAPILQLEAESLESSGELVSGVAVGPYLLEKHLGSGGMGVVYLARDPRLDRRVALKLLPAWLPVDDASTRRLTEEAKAASRLDHPHIQTVYEIGRAPDDRPFIAMAYYDGETLKDRIAAGPLDAESVRALAHQIADGLGAAHQHGIVHRDIKPGNLMVTPQGLVKILDFGAATISVDGLGWDGRALGTVSYMSPEQIRGEDVDARSDVWALGVVVYEMLTGIRPFQGDDAASLFRAVREEHPTPVQSLRPDAPPELVGLVERCLEKDPELRFPDAASVAEELGRHGGALQAPLGRPPAERTRSWPLVAALVGVSLLVAAILWPNATSTPGAAGDAVTGVGAAAPDARQLAVLPLVVAADRPDDEYLSEALTEELIADLHRVEGLDVATRGQVVPYEASPLSIDHIARILGVETVLSASVGEADDAVHLLVRLLDAASQEVLWSEDLVTPFSEVLTVERRIVAEVAEALGLNAPQPPGRLSAPSGGSPGPALRMYWKGQHFLHMLDTPRASRQALEYFDEAIRLDSAYAPAWAGRSGALHQLAIQGAGTTLELEPEAIKAAERALKLDEGLADAHTHLAAVQSWFAWNEEEADKHFRRALELDPRSARAHRFFAVHLRNHRKFEEALAYLRAGADLDPLSQGAYLQEGLILYMQGQYSLALAKYDQLLTIDSTYSTTHFYIALTHIEMARRAEDGEARARHLDDALTAIDALERTADTPMINQGLRRSARIQMGDPEVARSELARLESLEPTGNVLLNRAGVHSALSEFDRALDLLEEAVQHRPWRLQMLAVEPGYERLRSNADRPRLNALLETLGLPTLPTR